MLKVAMVGLGNISAAHVNAWKDIKEATLVAVCDIRPERMIFAQEKTGAKPYDNFKRMLDIEKPDILDICLPTYLHTAHALEAISRGIHVLTEKPLSLAIADVQKVYEEAGKKGVCFMTAQVVRFWLEYDLLKQAYESGSYGRLLSGNLSRMGHTPKKSWDNWMLDEKRSGLAPFDLHIHDLDFMVFAFGVPGNLQVHRARSEAGDDIHAVYEYPDFFISCQAAWFDCAYTFRSAYRFVFERAVMEYTGGTLTVYHQDGRVETPTQATSSFGDELVPTTSSYFNEIRYFTDCVLEGKPCDKVKEDELCAVLRLIQEGCLSAI